LSNNNVARNGEAGGKHGRQTTNKEKAVAKKRNGVKTRSMGGGSNAEFRDAMEESRHDNGGRDHPVVAFIDGRVPKNAQPGSYQLTGNLDDIDERDKEDPLCATEYVADMYKTFRGKEASTSVRPVYMENQKYINERMRAILVDWLVEVHLKFKLVPETLYLTMNLIDRYLEDAEVSRPKLQLVGVTCLLIASKYEEIYPPELRDLVYICDRAYTRTDVSIVVRTRSSRRRDVLFRVVSSYRSLAYNSPTASFLSYFLLYRSSRWKRRFSSSSSTTSPFRARTSSSSDSSRPVMPTSVSYSCRATSSTVPSNRTTFCTTFRVSWLQRPSSSPVGR